VRGGWGFNGRAPIDADSTAWGIAFLAATGGAPAAAYDALRAHRRADGGFCCYERFSDLSTHVSHVDVSAAALAALLHEPLRDTVAVDGCVAYLLDRQLPDGSWPSYWYATRLYSVAHVLRALAACGPTALAECRLVDAVRYAAGGPISGDAFSLALAAEVGLCFSRPDEANEFVSELLRLQRVDGRWTAGQPFMRPDPWNYAGDEGNAAVLDQYGLFTTATVVRALAVAVRRVVHRGMPIHA
jgi:squalene-hopene/tetraprenyl-beta-curcumene cyclase